MNGRFTRESSRSLKEQFSRSSEAWKEQSDPIFRFWTEGDWLGFPFFSLSASRYFGDKETLCLYWPLGTVVSLEASTLRFRKLKRTASKEKVRSDYIRFSVAPGTGHYEATAPGIHAGRPAASRLITSANLFYSKIADDQEVANPPPLPVFTRRVMAAGDKPVVVQG